MNTFKNFLLCCFSVLAIALAYLLLSPSRHPIHAAGRERFTVIQSGYVADLDYPYRVVYHTLHDNETGQEIMCIGGSTKNCYLTGRKW